jgi:hypothetical protein
MPGNKEKASRNKTMDVDFNVCDMFIKFFISSGFPNKADLFRLLARDGKLLSY